MSAGSSEATDTQPISGIGARDTEPPTAAASICPPKQIPSVGTPSEISDRAYAISSVIHGIVAVSYTDHAAPKNATASYSAADGNVDRDIGGVVPRLRHHHQLRHVPASRGEASPISPPGDEWSCLTKRTRTNPA